ncbi:MAG: alpha-galactosidase [Spirochaetales bacterium]|nr:alpha-galactosidase [Spirochaetales bacterium]
MIPNFILKKLYKKNSLSTAPGGIALTILNKIDTGYVKALKSVAVDGIDYGPECIEIYVPEQEMRQASDVEPSAPLPLKVGVEVTILVKGPSLKENEGKHEIAIRLDVQDLGNLDIRFKDSIHGHRDDITPSQWNAPSQLKESPQESVFITEEMRSHRPIKVVFLGAGSAVFCRNLVNDILCIPGLEQGEFGLVDIDEERLELAHQISEKMVQSSGKSWTVQSSVHREQILPGADFVISMIEVAGLRNVEHDYKIPLKYGIDQCIGDTIGPGGIFKMLRTGPSWLAILRDIERLCPQAMVMNYTNPMSALTLLGLQAVNIPLVGLCHSVQNTSHQLSLYLDIPYDELKWECAGINHMAWFTHLEHRGEDQYPRLRQMLNSTDLFEADPVRFEMMRQFGAFVTESSGHFSEYLPYFRKRPDLLQKYTREASDAGRSGSYAEDWPKARTSADQTIRELLSHEGNMMLQRGEEYASHIVEAWFADKPTIIHGNVLNQGMISNLPCQACVEVPVMVDRKGFHPVHFGALPPQMAALNQSHLAFHELAVKAIMEKDKEAAIHALMLDPLSAAVCSPAEIRSLFEEMWEAQAQDLEYFRP